MKEKLHTAEHIFYTVLNDKFNVITKAMQLTDVSVRVVYQCTVDLRKYQDELEKEVNQIIMDDYKIINYTLHRTEAQKAVDLSLVPEDAKQVSIYEIVGFNKLACIGPHVKNTSEIGKFKILKIEKKGQNCYSIKFIV